MTTTQVVELASVQGSSPRRCAARPPQRRAASLAVSRPPPGHCRYAPRRRLLLALPQCRCFVLQPRAPPPQRPVRRKGRTHRRAAPRRRFAATQRRVAVRREWPLAHRCHFAAPSRCCRDGVSARFGSRLPDVGVGLQVFSANLQEFGACMRGFGSCLQEFGARSRGFGARSRRFHARRREFGAG